MRKDWWRERERAKRTRIEKAVKRKPQEQLALLDKKFGKGMGAKKERAKLTKKIQES